MAGAILGRASAWRAFEQRNYRLFVAGQGVSLVGTWTQSVAESWLVYRLTGSAIWLAVGCREEERGGLLTERGSG